MSSFAGIDWNDVSQIRTVLQQLLADPSIYPAEFKSWLPNYLATNPPDLTVDQITGFQQFAATAASPINAEETKSGSAYGDLTTVGPQLTGLGDGKYVIWYGAGAAVGTSGFRAKMNVSINGAAPSDTTTPQAYTLSTVAVGVGGCSVVTLSAGISGNSIKCQYATTGASTNGTWGARWLAALKVSN